MLCFKRQVSLESLYGMWEGFFFSPRPFWKSDSVEITCLRVKRDLLISMLSFWATDDSFPVNEVFSDPARSTRSSLLTRKFSGFWRSTDSTLRLRIVCDLDEERLSLWEATILFLIPLWKCSKTSSAVLHSKTYKFSTTNSSFCFHRSRNPGDDWLILAICTGFSKSNIFSL